MPSVTDWELDPWAATPLLLSALYVRGVALLWRRAGVGRSIKRWQALCFAAGWIAVVSPLHELAEHLFLAHMIEHELLMAVAAPLLAVSRPLGAFLQALPRTLRSRVLQTTARRPVRSAWHWLLLPPTATALHAWPSGRGIFLRCSTPRSPVKHCIAFSTSASWVRG